MDEDNNMEQIMNMAKMFSSLSSNESSNDEDTKNNSFDIDKILTLFSLFKPLLNNRTTEENNSSNNLASTNIIFDEWTCNNNIRAIKSIIPYLDIEKQKLLSIFVKSLELNNTIKLYKDPNSVAVLSDYRTDENRHINMINSIKPYIDSNNRNILDLINKLIEVKKIMDISNIFLVNDEDKEEYKLGG